MDEPVAPEPPPPRAPSASRFVPALRIADGFEDQSFVRLFSTVDGSLFVTVGPQVIRVDDDGSIHRDASWLRGIEPDFPDALRDTVAHGLDMWPQMDVVYVGGRWPNATTMVLREDWGWGGYSAPNEVHRWNDDRWQPVEHANRRLVSATVARIRTGTKDFENAVGSHVTRDPDSIADSHAVFSRLSAGRVSARHHTCCSPASPRAGAEPTSERFPRGTHVADVTASCVVVASRSDSWWRSSRLDAPSIKVRCTRRWSGHPK